MPSHPHTNILYGPDESEDITEGTHSLGEYFLRNLKEHGTKTLIINEDTGEEIQANDLLQRSIRVAECLEDLGVGVGSKVSICSENRSEYYYVIFGTILVGATVTPISSFFSDVELNHSIGLCQPDIIFVSPSVSEKLLKVAEKHGCIENIIFLDNAERKSYKSYNEFINNPNVPVRQQFTCAPQDLKNNVVLILASSGTTGPSKGAELTQWNLFSSLSQVPIVPDLQFLVPSPLSYMSGFHTAFTSIIKGTTSILLSKFDPDSYLSCIQKYKLQIVFLNQSLMNFVAQNPLASKYDLSSIILLCYGGAKLAKSNYDAIMEKYPEVMIQQGYASTETGFITMQEPNVSPPESVGVLQASVSAAVVDTDTGSYLGPNELGEIRIKSNRMMKGYVGNPEATRTAFDENGFYKTGDIGYYDEDRQFFIVDRLKELIKYCGMQVYPNEIEAVLLEHPSVEDTCVIGLPDELAGELPLAFVVGKKHVIEKELIDHVAARLSSPQHLRGGVIFLPELPKASTGSGKSFRRTLKELAVKRKSKI